MEMSPWRRGLLTALSTLTAVPVGGREFEPEWEKALYWFVPVGFALGAAVCFPSLIFGGDGWGGAFAGGLLSLLLELLLTGGLHLDGAADLADSLFSGKDREEMLRILKDPRLGSFGAAALFLILATKLGGYLILTRRGSARFIIPLFALSRAAMVQSAASGKSARKGEGTGAPFILAADGKASFAAWATALVLSLPLLPPSRWYLPLIGICAAWGMSRWAGRRLGGVTGDVLGAVGEGVFSLLLVVVVSGMP
ncbi:MAG: adenosylcobinamide-GDP ribazoletransferase [Deltaproteobacteria bacterium]|nr:MAG: adenosylcobinamide-GDP ribazoletransferase [Deltaproteobacteria bacterium]